MQLDYDYKTKNPMNATRYKVLHDPRHFDLSGQVDAEFGAPPGRVMFDPEVLQNPAWHP